MTRALTQHQIEIERNRRAWENKPLLRQLYTGFYRRILALLDPALPGRILEIGSGIGNLKAHHPSAISSDLFPNPWLDLTCDGYELPFPSESLSHLILFDVFHHLQAPRAFLHEAARVLGPRGRVILFEPYISWSSRPVYGLLHHEPIAWRAPIDPRPNLPRPRHYYAAQGNATRVFFQSGLQNIYAGWSVLHAQAFASFSYLFSGGFSKPAFYPAACLGILRRLENVLSRFPNLFAARCLVALERQP